MQLHSRDIYISTDPTVLYRGGTPTSKLEKRNLSLANTLPFYGLSRHGPMDITLADVLVVIFL